MGEVFYRLAATLATPPRVAQQNIFAPLQLGLGTKGGVEAALHVLQWHIYLQRTILKLDVKNAFNSLHRHVALEELFQTPELHECWRLAHFAYSTQSSLIFHPPRQQPTLIPSTRGVRQGDPIGSMMFDVALQPVLSALARSRNVIDVVAIHDDIHIVLQHPTDVDSTLHHAASLMSPLGLSLAPAKCSVIVPPVHSDYTHPTIGVCTTATHSLGSVLGHSRPAMQEAFQDIVTQHQQLFQTLQDPDKLNTQEALLLLRASALPRIVHLLRTTPLQLIEDAAR
jgi:hypothetical protein